MNVIAVAASTTLMNRGSRSMSYDRRIPKSINRGGDEESMPFVNLHSSMESVRLGHVWSDDSDDDSEDSDGIEISTEDMDRNELFELVLQDVGGFGPYQRWLLLLSSVSCFLCAFNHLGTAFMAYTPKFACQDGVTENLKFNSTCTTECTSYAYDKSVMLDTVVGDFGLVCGRESLLAAVSATYVAGVVLASLTCGFLSDRVGRRPVLLLMSAVHVCGSLATYASKYSGPGSSSPAAFLAARFFVGGSAQMAFSAMYVIAMEVTGKENRGLTGAIINWEWAAGSMITTASAYFLRSWYKMQLFFGVYAILLLFYFLVPESPRWLLENGRPEDAKVILLQIARSNRKAIRINKFERHFEELAEKDRETRRGSASSSTSLMGSLKEALRVREYRKRALVLILPWFALGASFAYGTHLAVGFVPRYLDVFGLAFAKDLAAAVAVAAVSVVYDRLNRSTLVPWMFVLGGSISLAAAATYADEDRGGESQAVGRVALYLASQSIVAAAQYAVGVYCLEVFSTDTRSLSFAVADSISKIGSLALPFMVDVRTQLPLAAIGVLLMLSSSVFLFSPETRGRSLIQNVHDLELSGQRSIAEKHCGCCGGGNGSLQRI